MSMKRELKFRAWDKIDNKWRYFVIGQSMTTLQRSIYDSLCLNGETFQQFTGLLDKNGKEIYEGAQLFITAGYLSRVEFQDGMFVSVYDHPEDPETIPLIDAIGKDTEVVTPNF